MSTSVQQSKLFNFILIIEFYFIFVLCLCLSCLAGQFHFWSIFYDEYFYDITFEPHQSVF